MKTRTQNTLAAARGEIPCDLVITGGRIANVLSLEYENADIAVHNGIIVGVGVGYEGKTIVDATGTVLMPGMIDGHLHIESTMLTPSAFASVVLPRGTTTVLPDPHEIANTCGTAGIKFMCKDAAATPLDAFFAAPSCVPASRFETARCEITVTQMTDLYDRDLCTHLGEMMNFPGVIAGDADVWDKINASIGLVRTGHAPGVSGRDLCAYLLSGCNADHECTQLEEAREKLRRGTWIMLREGVVERNMDDLLELLLEDESRFARCMVVSDDLTAERLVREGHLDHLMRKMCKKGLRPLIAAALVTINPAKYFRLDDRGAIAPGRLADIVMLSSLEECHVIKVWKRGVPVAENGQALFKASAPDFSQLPVSANLKNLPDEDALKVKNESGKNIRVIELIPGQILSGQSILPPRVRGIEVVSDVERDIVKLVVMEKNLGTGRLGIGFVRGFGLKRGAIASSVAHDAHNFIALGVDDTSIMTALNCLIHHHGGQVAALGGDILASLPLPVGGLMSTLAPIDLAVAAQKVARTAQSLGMSVAQPFMALSFLSLSVIPELKLTDQGYVNISGGGRLNLFIDA